MEEVVWIVPISNFDSDTKLVRFSERLCLKRISRTKLENLLGKLTSDVTLFLSLLEAKYVLENRIVPPSIKDERNDVILALRLLKAGDLIVLAAFHTRKGNRVCLRTYDDLNRMLLPSNSYFLKSEETTDLIELWKIVRNRTPKSYLEFPIRKFMEAYDKQGFDDRIVDYMLAFESIVFHGRDRSIQPAGEVIGIAIGMLLGDNLKDRTKIKKTLEKAYELRSAKVHGNVKKLRNFGQNIKTLSMDVEDYLRRALRRLIKECMHEE